jgi:hypothetical protein
MDGIQGCGVRHRHSHLNIDTNIKVNDDSTALVNLFGRLWTNVWGRLNSEADRREWRL